MVPAGSVWIFPIEVPAQRIVDVILANTIQRFLIANDVLLRVALPHCVNVCLAPYLLRHTNQF